MVHAQSMFKLNHIFRNVRYREFDHMENVM